jgi:hypothetical protein
MKLVGFGFPTKASVGFGSQTHDQALTGIVLLIAFAAGI